MEAIIYLIVYTVGVTVVCWSLFHKRKDQLNNDEEVALFFACELTNAIWLMTKEQYVNQLKIWEKSYGKNTLMGDALAKESFDMAESFLKEAKLRKMKTKE